MKAKNGAAKLTAVLDGLAADIVKVFHVLEIGEIKAMLKARGIEDPERKRPAISKRLRDAGWLHHQAPKAKGYGGGVVHLWADPSCSKAAIEKYCAKHGGNIEKLDEQENSFSTNAKRREARLRSQTQASSDLSRFFGGWATYCRTGNRPAGLWA